MLADQTDRQQLLNQLRQRVADYEGKPRDPTAGIIPTSCPALDSLLPLGGWRRGGMVEWLAPETGWTSPCLFWAARQIAGRQGVIAISDPSSRWYAQAAAAWDIAANQLLVIRPQNRTDELWALDQALRSPGVAVVWGSLRQLTQREARKLQLAAETGGTCAFFMRPAKVRGQPTWADVQLLVHTHPCHPHSSGGMQRRWHIEITRARWGAAGGSLVLELDTAGRTFRPVNSSTPVATTHVPLSLPATAELARATVSGSST